ncbi:MAG: prepilin-type N-terminal cleavage/methylation domain-containing protein [Syntrophaceae bacterium]
MSVENVWKKELRRGEECGFTLLEILVALSILAIAITLILQLYSVNLKAVSISGNVASALVRGDSRLREILAGQPLTDTVWTEVTEDGYRVDVTVSEVLQERTENLPVKLMEVALTIRWYEGTKEKGIKLKTMKMVDRTESGDNSTASSV